MALLTCNHVSFAYEGRSVVTDVNFSVHTGDYVCIIGENGAGKSTLLKGLLHLKKPSSGTISYGDNLCANEIGYLPQQTFVQKDFPASVQEVVLSGCLNALGHRPFFNAAVKKRAMEKMKRFNIMDLQKRCYRDLSGGQQQRVLLTRALCATQKLLLLDEPVAGLDPGMAMELYRLIRELHTKEKLTIIMVSHDIQGAIQEADHILHIDNQQKFFGTKEAYVSDPIGKAFLGGMTV